MFAGILYILFQVKIKYMYCITSTLNETTTLGKIFYFVQSLTKDETIAVQNNRNSNGCSTVIIRQKKLYGVLGGGGGRPAHLLPQPFFCPFKFVCT